MSLTFRPATLADVPTVVALINAAYRGDSSRAGWTTEADLLEGIRTDAIEITELITKPDSVIVLAMRGDEIMGTVHLEKQGDNVYLGMFVVKPTLQAQGIGKRFLDVAEHEARARWNPRKVTMTVIAVRDELIAWYERRGYRRTGQRTPFPDVAPSTPLVDGLEFEQLEKPFEQDPATP